MLRDKGERGLALKKLERAVALDPDNPLGRCLLGRAFAEEGLYDAARACFDSALSMDSGYADALIDLGTVYRLEGDIAQAESTYRRALEVDPTAAMAHYNIALLHLHQGSVERALRHLRIAHHATPMHGTILKLLVTTLTGRGELEEAERIAETASRAYPSLQEAWLSLGHAHQKWDRPTDALDCYDKAHELRPDDAEVFNYRAIALQDLGRMTEALKYYDAALALLPGFQLARFHRALAYLATGNYAAGWPDYEIRLKSTDVPARAGMYPRWEGGPLDGRAILIYGEQGLGDEIMFASCLPEVISSAGRCIIECSPKLYKIFQRSFPSATICAPVQCASDSDVLAGVNVDYELPIGSLPLYYRRSVADFPRHAGYLKADSERVAAWRKRLDALGPGFKVGISWRGGTQNTHGPVRSIELERWAPILRVPGISFVSLQYASGANLEVEALPQSERSRIACWEEAVADYEDTAALVSALDLTLSVCTAVVHLAGSLGRPVWVLAPYSPEWRYGHAGNWMPWYPSARIFRQQEYGEWATVIEAVSARLHEHRGTSLALRA